MSVVIFKDVRAGLGGGGITFYRKINDALYVAAPVELDFKKVEPFAFDTRATIQFDGHEINQIGLELANQLHEMGFRPDKAKPLENELTAVRYHLEDMRRLVFHE